MMKNGELADMFSMLAKLMELHADNPFRAKSYANVAFAIDRHPEQIASIPPEKIQYIKGIGASSAEKIQEVMHSGRLQLLDEYIKKTPDGVLEMMSIKGIGPKKLQVIWQEMGIESVGELLYACEENRLLLYKGFGQKTQENIKNTLQYYLSGKGSLLYAQALPWHGRVWDKLSSLFAGSKLQTSGAIERQMETVHSLEYVLGMDVQKAFGILAAAVEGVQVQDETLVWKQDGLPMVQIYCAPHTFTETYLRSSSSAEFMDALHTRAAAVYAQDDTLNAADVFKNLGLAYVPAYAREEASTLALAAASSMPTPIQVEDIKGIIHAHSMWSDGADSLEAMSVAAKNAGLQYLIISDHSRSAFYANGLTPERVAAQHLEVDALNAKLAPFKIFKSIESDILANGSLDYSDDVLDSFDLVIASIHSILNMPEERANERLLTAIKNPYTAILGHVTGRLLLSRKGYPVNHALIIDACVEHDVAIELNAHPRRLDIDWRYIGRAVAKGALISIDPDAHSIEGFADIAYGVKVAQKALLLPQQNLSSYSLQQMEDFVLRQKQKRKAE